MSDTPRTDAEDGDATNAMGEPIKVVPSSFARQLERELAEMTLRFDEVFEKWKAIA